MKKNIVTLVAVMIVLINGVMGQKVVSGVKIPDKLGFGGTVRELNGVGTRVKYMMHIYVGALYLKEKSKDPKVIINADKPMSVRLQIVSSLLTNETMVRYIREGFSRSVNGKIEPLKEELDLICELFSSSPTKVGDVYDIHYTPGIGVSASKNAKPYSFQGLNSIKKSSSQLNTKMKTLKYTKNGQVALPGLDFKKALFGIWLSDDPVDEDLKDAMLGIGQ